MKNVPVTLEGQFLGTKNERIGDNVSTLAVFLVGLDSIPMFIPGNLEEKVQKWPKMQLGVISASVTFRDNKPGGYFALKDFIPEKAAK